MSRSTLRREAHMRGEPQPECDEHDRCVQRDKAECEWCLAPATTPANPTDQIATVAATPAVAPDAQRYDWREDLDMATDYGSTMSLDAAARVATYIERLEAERDAR